MIITIIKWEILNYLKTAKFVIGMGVTAILVILSTIVNLGDYARRHQDYLDAGKADTIDQAKQFSRITIFRPPQTLSVLVQGNDRVWGNKLEFNAYQDDVPYRPSGYLDDNERMHFRFISGFQAVDYAFIVRILMSLMVIFLAYNCVCGEKTEGTLRAVLSNSVPRDTLLFGKLAAGMLVVCIFLAVSSILAFLAMLTNPSIDLSGSDIVRILGIAGLSLLYLLFFYGMSVLVSISVDRPSFALALLLQLWIVIVSLYPNVGIGLTDALYPLPAEREISQRKDDIVAPLDRQRLGLLNELYKSKNMDSKTLSTLKENILNLGTEIKKKRAGIDEEYIRKMNHQVRSAKTLTFLSPAMLYDFAVERFALTGPSEFERFMDGANRIKRSYEDMMRHKGIQAHELSYEREDLSTSYRETLSSWTILGLMTLIILVLARTLFIRKDIR